MIDGRRTPRAAHEQRRRRGGTALTLFALVAAFALRPGAVAAQQPGAALEATTAVVATGVENREPVGVTTSFPATVGTVYFYTVLEGDFEPRTVEHVWVRNGVEVGRVQLAVQGPHWRTWSSKTIPVDWTGEWEARLFDADGSVLATAAFTVGG